MSRKRIVEGVDERGRPKARWEDVPDQAPAFGHMQPAYDTTVERRHLTEAEIANRADAEDKARQERLELVIRAGERVVDGRPSRPALNSPEHLQQSRMNGARRHQEVMAARRPEEEPNVATHETIETIDLEPLDHLSQVAAAAERARQAKAAADEAWDIAREALDAAMAGVQRLVLVTVPDTSRWLDMSDPDLRDPGPEGGWPTITGPAPTRVIPAPVYAWLIERGQPERQSPPIWWTEASRWTEDVVKATRFDTREAAEEVIARKFTPLPSRGGPSARAVLHSFIDAEAFALPPAAIEDIVVPSAPPAIAAKRQAGHHPAKAGEAQEKAERARRVMEAMARHHGDKRAVAAELGMKANAVAMVAKHAGVRTGPTA